MQCRWLYPSNLNAMYAQLCKLGLVLLILSFANPVFAHFEHLLARIVHVSEEGHGLRVYTRIPLALVLLPKNWKGVDAGQQLDHTITEKINGVWRYYVDRESINSNRASLANKIIGSYHITIGTKSVSEYSYDKFRIYSFKQRPSFNSLKKAQASFRENTIALSNEANKIFGTPNDKPSSFNPANGLGEILNENVNSVDDQAIEVFDFVVDVSFFIPHTSLQSGLRIQSQLGSHLSIIDRVVNIVLFHTSDDEVMQTTAGVLDASIKNKVSITKKITSQARSGIKHILIGMDHILFIFLLILATSAWLDGLKKVTAFTVGHSITLGVGVYGFTPTVSWFIPFVETTIAASIVYAGISIILGHSKNFNSSKIFLIGLLHGFGFSFVINEVLFEQGSISVSHLLGFNLGIEIGQLFIIILIAPILFLLDKYFLCQPTSLRQGLSLPCILIASFWVFERGSDTLHTIQTIF